MQFLNTLFWMVVAVVLAAFTYRNWQGVPINLWGGLQAEVKLPVLLLATFLIGFIPGMILHRATLWRLRRKVENARIAAAIEGPVEPALPLGAATPPAAFTGAPLPSPAAAPPLVP